MKKKYIALQQVLDFIERQNADIKLEYNEIVGRLEKDGRLTMPFGEKVETPLFAIRVISAGNIRVFYIYGKDNQVYGIYAYEKKTGKIPKKELDHAKSIVKAMKKEKMI
jgi:phage-related protein